MGFHSWHHGPYATYVFYGGAERSARGTFDLSQQWFSPRQTGAALAVRSTGAQH